MFFWAFLPETAKRPLEEMRYLFTEAPLFVPTMDVSRAYAYDIERRVEEAEHKVAVARDEEDPEEAAQHGR